MSDPCPLDPLPRRVRIGRDVLVRELGGESVLLNLRNESYFGLDEVGTRMWEALLASPSVEAACETLQQEYDVAPEVLRADLGALIEKLAGAGLVDLADG